MRVASIDIGTNSVLLLVAEQRPSGEVIATRERATITRLGEGVDRTGELAPAAIERTLACLRDYAEQAKELGVIQTVAVGTSAMRDARGGAAFAAEAAKLLGSQPRVISGEEEARLTFAGSLAGLPLEGDIAVFDVGGGSTEIVSGRRQNGAVEISSSVSLNIGSVRLTERHLHTDPPTSDELAALIADVDGQLAALPRLQVGTSLVGVAGTVTTLAAVAKVIAPYDGAKVHGARLTSDEIAETAKRLALLSLADRKSVTGLEPKRADVIVAGAFLVSRLIQWANVAEIGVSDRGVRWGLALETLAQASKS